MIDIHIYYIICTYVYICTYISSGILDIQAFLDELQSELSGVVTYAVYSYLRRGLLDADKLTVASMLSLKILVREGRKAAMT